MSKMTFGFGVVMVFISLYSFYISELSIGTWELITASWIFYSSNMEDRRDKWIKYSESLQLSLDRCMKSKYEWIRRYNELNSRGNI